MGEGSRCSKEHPFVHQSQADHATSLYHVFAHAVPSAWNAFLSLAHHTVLLAKSCLSFKVHLNVVIFSV